MERHTDYDRWLHFLSYCVRLGKLEWTLNTEYGRAAATCVISSSIILFGLMVLIKGFPFFHCCDACASILMEWFFTNSLRFSPSLRNGTALSMVDFNKIQSRRSIFLSWAVYTVRWIKLHIPFWPCPGSLSIKLCNYRARKLPPVADQSKAIQWAALDCGNSVQL